MVVHALLLILALVDVDGLVKIVLQVYIDYYTLLQYFFCSGNKCTYKMMFNFWVYGKPGTPEQPRSARTALFSLRLESC